MAAIVSTRIGRLQAVSPRATSGIDQSGVVVALSASAVALPADSAGTVTSYANATTTISVTHGGVDQSDSWTFTKSDSSGVTSTLSGRTLTVSSLVVDLAKVTITASRAGYASQLRTFSLSRARAGTNGANGTNGTNGATGQRGSVTLYASGSAWSDSTADSAIASATGSYTRVIGDTVTISSASFAKTKYWGGTAWLDVGTVLDGNLLVHGTVSANVLSGGLLSGVSININGNFIVDTNGLVSTKNMIGDFANFRNVLNGYQAAVYAFSTGEGPGLRCGNSNPEGLALRIEGHCTSTGNISISGKYYGDGSSLSGITATNANYATSAGSASTAGSATTAGTASYANAVGAWPYYAAMAGSDNFAAFNSGTAFWSAKYGYGSDIALKENVVSTEKVCLPLVNQIRVVDFDWKDKGFGDGRVTGVVAQELELITPELVNELTGVKMVNYTMLTPYLVKAVQELSAKVAALEAK